MIAALRTWLRGNPARELALIGHAKHRSNVRETTQQIRRELNLPPDPRLFTRKDAGRG